MATEDQEVLTLQEAAKWLRISERTMWDRRGEFPFFKAGNQLRILKSALREAVQERSSDGC